MHYQPSQNSPDPRIADFIKKHHVFTLATCVDGQAWCSNMFYSYIRERNLFVFTSDDQTRHGMEMAANQNVAASIVLETRVVGKVQGLQMTGRVRKAGDDDGFAKKAYLRRFPYAAAATLNLWILEPFFFKLTDNMLGFGKKIVWVATVAAATPK